MPKSLAISSCFNFLEWTCRCSFEDSGEHQETLWSSKDWTHFESQNNNPPISLVSSPFFISFLCHSTMVTGCYLSSDLNEVLVLMNLSHFNGFNFAILEVGNQGPSSLHQVWLFNLFCFSEKGKDTTGQIYQPKIWDHAHPDINNNLHQLLRLFALWTQFVNIKKRVFLSVFQNITHSKPTINLQLP